MGNKAALSPAAEANESGGMFFASLAALGVGALFLPNRAAPARFGLTAPIPLSGLQSAGGYPFALLGEGWGRELAVHLVGAAAWQCAPRDAYIGWNSSQRAAHLPAIANHSRFLILPWVRVPHLASHLLNQLTRRLPEDWLSYHGWKLLLLESFVEVGRFAGTAYRAANWQEVGQTTGRTRQEKEHRIQAARKSVWVYPLSPNFRRHLGLGGGQ